MLKKMSRECMIFDRSGCSERIIVFHVRDFSISAFGIDGIDGFQNGGNEFQEIMALGVGALENAKFSRVLSMPLLEEEFSWGSSSSEVAASMPDEKQQEKVEMADYEEVSHCYSGEDGDEVDALLNFGDKLADTADSMEVQDHRSNGIKKPFERLRDLVGGDWMDTVDVLDEAIRCVKRLELDLRNLNDSCDM